MTDPSSNKKDILKTIWPCMIFQVLVTEKKEDKLFVVLKELLSFCYDGDELPDTKYDYRDFKDDIIKSPTAYAELKNVHSYQIKGQIKKYEIDELNTMAYFISFNKIRKGDLLIAIIKRKEDDLVTLSLKNTYISGSRQRKFENYDSNSKKDNSCFYRLGFMDVMKAERNIIEVDPFFEDKLNFPNNNLLDLISSNYAEYNQSLESLQIKDPNATLNFWSNRKVITELSFDMNKIRETQNKVWAQESLNQGIELTQHKLYKEAQAYFDNAISMDETLVDAYVAKGCALANMSKFEEGLVLLGKAMEMDPENENAKIYYEAVMNKLREAERDKFKIDDRTKVTLVRTKKASEKEKESYADLVLSDSEEAESRSKKSKKKRK